MRTKNKMSTRRPNDVKALGAIRRRTLGLARDLQYDATAGRSRDHAWERRSLFGQIWGLRRSGLPVRQLADATDAALDAAQSYLSRKESPDRLWPALAWQADELRALRTAAG